MVKIGLILTLITTLNANNLYNACLKCHRDNRLPNKMIYKKYLMKYSTKENMKRAMFNYLKNPDPKNSIMPMPFFDKFNIQKKLDMSDEELLKYIEEFIEKFDIQKNIR